MTSNIRVLRPVSHAAPAAPTRPAPSWWDKNAPELRPWLAEHAKRMTLTEESVDTSVMLTIELNGTYAPARPWRVSWRKAHKDGERVSETFGRFYLSAMELEGMFGLDDVQMNALADMGVVVADQKAGAYFREGPYLNVPAPSVPDYHASSISVLLTDYIRDSVKTLLS